MSKVPNFKKSLDIEEYKICISNRELAAQEICQIDPDQDIILKLCDTLNDNILLSSCDSGKTIFELACDNRLFYIIEYIFARIPDFANQGMVTNYIYENDDAELFDILYQNISDNNNKKSNTMKQFYLRVMTHGDKLNLTRKIFEKTMTIDINNFYALNEFIRLFQNEKFQCIIENKSNKLINDEFIINLYARCIRYNNVNAAKILLDNNIFTEYCPFTNITIINLVQIYGSEEMEQLFSDYGYDTKPNGIIFYLSKKPYCKILDDIAKLYDSPTYLGSFKFCCLYAFCGSCFH